VSTRDTRHATHDTRAAQTTHLLRLGAAQQTAEEAAGGLLLLGSAEESVDLLEHDVQVRRRAVAKGLRAALSLVLVAVL
jgi:hypothetical protein